MIIGSFNLHRCCYYYIPFHVKNKNHETNAITQNCQMTVPILKLESLFFNIFLQVFRIDFWNRSLYTSRQTARCDMRLPVNRIYWPLRLLYTFMPGCAVIVALWSWCHYYRWSMQDCDNMDEMLWLEIGKAIIICF